MSWAYRVDSAKSVAQKAKLVREIMEWVDECERLRAERNKAEERITILNASMGILESNLSQRTAMVDAVTEQRTNLRTALWDLVRDQSELNITKAKLALENNR